MTGKNYRRGYQLERYCCLTLEYNKYHIVRKSLSVGIEDVLAFSHGITLLIQCKNTKRGEKSMSKDEIEILKKHAKEFGAIPIYLYKDGRSKYVWLDVQTGFILESLKPVPKEWLRERMKMREKLRQMKKKNLIEYNKYVLANWETVNRFIC